VEHRPFRPIPLVRAGPVSLHHRTVGRGPDVVLIHGLAADLSFWYLRYVPHLAHRFRVVTYDLRGHGLSSMPPSGYTTRSMAHDLARLLDALGIDRAHLAGHSFGGAVALHLAVLAPDRVRSLALVDARVPALQPLLDGKERAQWKRMRARVRSSGGRIDADVPRVAYSYLDELARLEGAGRESLPPTGRRAAARWRTLLETTTALPDITRPAGLTAARISAVRQPTLASYGELSHCLPTARRLTQLLPQIELHTVAGLGHFHPIAQPSALVATLSSFWDRTGAGTRPLGRSR
jgi:pimeloyl-ACP methyl ester carboxylesterase